MTQETRDDNSRIVNEAATQAVTLSRLEAMNSTLGEFRKEFQRYAERNGERVAAVEKVAVQLETLLKVHADEIAAIKKAQADSLADRRSLDTRVSNLETAMNDLQALKNMALGQLIALLLTVVVFGSLFAYVLLRPAP